MIKKVSKLLLVVFPLCLLGALAQSYNMKNSNDTSFQDIGIWAGILIGSVTAIFLIGFLTYVHFMLFAVPEDLFTGPMFGNGGPLFGGNPAIFRQGLATSLGFCGSGLGFIISDPIFKIATFGIGTSLLMPGVAGSILIIGLWRRLPEKNDATNSPPFIRPDDLP
jgi:hypothetical protein